MAESNSTEEQEEVLLQNVSPGSPASQSLQGEIGVIESVQLENFMCHAMLGPVAFGPNLNFVVGGKGKSALLSALVVGLSAKSSDLSLRDFVREGENTASVSITLRNRGDSAFKYYLYGESITVQQCINLDAGLCYKLKDQAGNVVCNDKEELIDILDYFEIRMDNPVSVLQQEMSRQLLQMRNDKDRYTLFMKATKLEQMRDEYVEILEKKLRSQEELDQGKEHLEELKNQGRVMQTRLKNMVALKKKLENLEHEMAWALVTETERDIVALTSNISVEEQQTVTLYQELEASKVRFDEAQKKQIYIQENIQKLNEEAASLEPKFLERKEKAEKSNRDYFQAKAFFYSCQNELSKLERVAEHLQKKIEDPKKSQKVTELEKGKKMFTLKEKLKTLRKKEETLIQEIKQIHRTVEKDEEEHFRLKKEEVSMQQTLNAKQRQLDHMKYCRSEPLRRFGPQIPALVEAIEDAHRQGQFTFKPLGPLGTCIRLRDPEFVLAVECCLRGLLPAFICDNHNDEQVLRELMHKVYPSDPLRPQIIVSPFKCELYDVTEKAVFHPEFPSVLATLEIDEAVVANILIDMVGIESVLLVKSSPMAHTVMHDKGLPKNCRKILTASGDEVYRGCYCSCEESTPTYLGDIEVQISNLAKEVENRIAQLSAYQKHLCFLERDIKKNRETIDCHYQYLKEIRFAQVSISSQLKEFEDETEKQSTDLSVLEKKAQETKEKMKEVEEKMKIQKKKMESLRQLKINEELRFEEFKVKCNQVSKLLQSLMEEQSQATLEVDTQHQSVLDCESRLQDHLNSLQEKKEELATKRRKLQKETVLAKHMCSEHTGVTRPVFVLAEEIRVLKQTIQSENHIYGSEEEMKKQFQEIRERYLDLSAEVRNLENFIRTLRKTASKKNAIHQKHRRSLPLQCKFYFESLLSQWYLLGKICFDHENETLSVTVQPAEENKAAFSGTEVFSGDTQAFSNFLFMISLWAITKSPFRCLDSFDIYMNSAQRNIAMSMILSIAYSQQHSQFILITPECVPSLPPSPLIEILQLPDPESRTGSPHCQEVNPEED